MRNRAILWHLAASEVILQTTMTFATSHHLKVAIMCFSAVLHMLPALLLAIPLNQVVCGTFNSKDNFGCSIALIFFPSN